tara:strand:+ start:3758 stop:4489 length:732 start_codon:yes stop_codon:yes gene_type:complete
MKNFLIFGGSKGIGASISKKLSKQGNKVFVICRNNISVLDKYPNVEIIEVDLLNLDQKKIMQIYKDYPLFDGICFSQRYRLNNSSLQKNSINEYNIMVDSIANSILMLKEFKQSLNNNKLNHTRILLIGSSYATRVGNDQDWSYHSIKASQLSLVRYFSIHCDGFFNINMLSPATFKKEGTDSYWEKQYKNIHWKKFIQSGLINSDILSDSAIDLLTNSSIYLSGNNISIDGGLCNLYHDQIS